MHSECGLKLVMLRHGEHLVGESAQGMSQRRARDRHICRESGCEKWPATGAALPLPQGGRVRERIRVRA